MRGNLYFLDIKHVFMVNESKWASNYSEDLWILRGSSRIKKYAYISSLFFPMRLLVFLTIRGP